MPRVERHAGERFPEGLTAALFAPCSVAWYPPILAYKCKDWIRIGISCNWGNHLKTSEEMLKTGWEKQFLGGRV